MIEFDDQEYNPAVFSGDLVIIIILSIFQTEAVFLMVKKFIFRNSYE